MNSIKKTLAITNISLRKLLHNPRFYLLMAIAVLITYETISEINEVCVQLGFRVTPWVFTFIMNHPYSGTIMLFGLVLLFCDAPFMDAGQTLTMLRSGKCNWCAGQLLYIAICTFGYFTLIFAVQCIILSPSLTFQGEWGKIISTFAHNGQRVGLIVFSTETIRHFDGITTTLLYFGKLWLAGTLLGVTMFVLNLLSKRSIGAIAGAVLVLMQSFVNFVGSSPESVDVFYLSLFSFIQPMYYTGTNYVIAVYSALVIILTVAVFVSIKAISLKDIHTLPEI